LIAISTHLLKTVPNFITREGVRHGIAAIDFVRWTHQEIAQAAFLAGRGATIGVPAA
jgi:hypothetical protein